MIRIDHPPIGTTERPNFSMVTLPDIRIWFSYATPIAFETADQRAIRKNEWGPTTGRHLKYVESTAYWSANWPERIDEEQFTQLLLLALAKDWELLRVKAKEAWASV